MNNLSKQAVSTYLYLGLIAMACLWFYWQFNQNGDAGVSQLYLQGSFEQFIEQGMLWQLLTPSLIHFTEVHLVTNLFLWWYFGRFIGFVSLPWLLGLTLSAALVSNSLQWFASDTLFGGLSGVVSAIIGFLASESYFAKKPKFFFNPYFFIAYILYLGVVATGYFGLYSNTAHFVGLFWGCVFGLCFVGINIRTDEIVTERDSTT